MDINNNFLCNICKKSYSSLSSLNYHQKNTKFCLSLQDKLNSGELIRCEYCLKEFTSKKYLSQHSDTCKEKKIIEQNELRRENDRLKKDLDIAKKELSDMKLTHELKIQSKDELIERMQKEIDEYKKMANRPTTSIVNNNSNNYQIQFNQLVQNIETFNQDSLSNKIKSITIEEMDSYDPRNLEDSFSHTLSNTFKDYAFCTDKARKMVVIKKEDGTTEKIPLKDFTNKCLKLGLVDIRKYIHHLEEHYDLKWNNENISTENFGIFDESLQKIKESFKRENIDITDNGHPLKMLPDKILSNCRHINKQ
jgi:hypothetical protein